MSELTEKEAALLAEIQRLREAVAKAREALVIGISFIGRDQGTDRIDTTLDQLCERFIEADKVALSALSTPFEVASPNPDEVAGTYSAFEASEPVAGEYSYEVLKESHDMLHEAATSMGYPSATEALEHLSELREPVADESGGEGEISDDYLDALQRQVDAKKPADFKLTPLATPPNPTNGDAVREAGA